MMGEDMEGSCEFCLPADFLTDDFFHDEAVAPGGGEIESEDEYVAGLARQMAAWSLAASARDTAPKMGTSPKSTLWGMRSWSFSSSGGSPDGPSKVCSPPSSPFPPPARDDALDLLYAAAGQVARLRLNDELVRIHGLQWSARDLLVRRQLHQLQSARFYELRRQQVLKLQLERLSRARCDYEAEMAVAATSALPPPPLSKPRWRAAPPPRQAAVRPAAFLHCGGDGVRRESKGTGVFLPQRAGAPYGEPKKRPAPTPVPFSVDAQLDLDVDDVSTHPHVHGTYTGFHGGLMMGRGQALPGQARRSPAHDGRLPPEWTY